MQRIVRNEGNKMKQNDIFRRCERCKNWNKDKKECIIYGYLLKSYCMEYSSRKKSKELLKMRVD